MSQDIFTQIIDRMSYNNIISIKDTIDFLSEWLYELNNDTTRKCIYANVTNNEVSSLYSIIEQDLYKTNFSFTLWGTNKNVVITYFIKEVYNIPYTLANTVYKMGKNSNENDEYLYNMITEYLYKK